MAPKSIFCFFLDHEVHKLFGIERQYGKERVFNQLMMATKIAFLLCEEYQKEKPRTHRMTRHFYDLEKLMQTPYCEMALQDVTLYHEIVEHRRKFYHVGYVDYDMDLPANIQIVPDEELMPSFEADYKAMKKSFIYGKALDFDVLIERLKTLQDRFRAI